MAPLIPISAALKGASSLGALNNDLAVYRYSKGKGKKKKDVEIHVNPVSIGVGLGAVAVAGAMAVGVGAIGLYAAGLGASREQGSTKGRTVVLITAAVPAKTTPATARPARYAVRNERGVPIRYISGTPTADNVLSPSDLSRGWTVKDFQKVGDGYSFTAANDSKGHFSLYSRSRGGLISIGGGKLF